MKTVMMGRRLGIGALSVVCGAAAFPAGANFRGRYLTADTSHAFDAYYGGWA